MHGCEFAIPVSWHAIDPPAVAHITQIPHETTHNKAQF